MGIEELTKKLAKESGVKKIQWKRDSYGSYFYEAQDKVYFLEGNSIFFRDEKEKDIICYSCGGKAEINLLYNEKRHYDMFCPVCEPEKKIKQSDYPYFGGEKSSVFNNKITTHFS
jgi:hypothetical protein